MATLNGPFRFHDVDVVFACCVHGGRVRWHHSTVGPHDLIKHEVEPSAVLRLHSGAGSTVFPRGQRIRGVPVLPRSGRIRV